MDCIVTLMPDPLKARYQVLGTFSSLPGALPGVEESHSHIVWSLRLLGGYQAVIKAASRARPQPGQQGGHTHGCSQPSPPVPRPCQLCSHCRRDGLSPLQTPSEQQARFPAAVGEKESIFITQGAKQAQRKNTYLRS